MHILVPMRCHRRCRGKEKSRIEFGADPGRIHRGDIAEIARAPARSLRARMAALKSMPSLIAQHEAGQWEGDVGVARTLMRTTMRELGSRMATVRPCSSRRRCRDLRAAIAENGDRYWGWSRRFREPCGAPRRALGIGDLRRSGWNPSPSWRRDTWRPRGRFADSIMRRVEPEHAVANGLDVAHGVRHERMVMPRWRKLGGLAHAALAEINVATARVSSTEDFGGPRDGDGERRRTTMPRSRS